MHAKKLLVISFFFLAILPISAQDTEHKTHKADIIVYSYDRPLQLDALLTSIKKYITNVERVTVIYRASNAEFNSAYDEVKDYFPKVRYIQQGSAPKTDFKPYSLWAIGTCESKYILFAVDDNIVTDYVDLNECIHALEKTNAYGFYLRLGKNITESYTRGDLKLKIPPLQEVFEGIFAFQFKYGQSYWSWVNSLDMCLYKKIDLMNILPRLEFHAPNIMEDMWNRCGNRNATGLCFARSKMINIPMNKVQNEYKNRHENSFSPKELLAKWHQGFTIDIDTFFQVNNPSVHVPYVPTFTLRDK